MLATLGLLLLLAVPLLALSTTAIQDPYSIYGKTYNNIGPASATVVIEDSRTGEQITTTSDGTGYYQQNLLNMPSGYRTGDTIVVTASTSTLTGSNSTTVKAGQPGSTVMVYMTTPRGGGEAYTATFHAYDAASGANLGSVLVVVHSGESEVASVTTDSDGLATCSITTGTFTASCTRSSYTALSKAFTIGGDTTVQLPMTKEGAASAAPVSFPILSSDMIIVIVIIALILVIAAVATR